MIQFKENVRTDGRKNGQTLFYRTLPATAGGSKNGTIAAFLTIKSLQLYETCPFYSQIHPLNFDMEAFNLTFD